MFVIASSIKLNQEPSVIRESIVALTKNRKYNPDLYHSSGILAYMLFENTKDPADEALSFSNLKQAKQMDQTQSKQLLAYAYVSYLSGNRDLAEQLLTQSLGESERQNNNFYNYILLAEIQLERGNLDGMSKSLQEAYKIVPIQSIYDTIQLYNSGNFQMERLPVQFPRVDIL